MNYNRIMLWVMMGLMSFFVISCSEDIDTPITTEALIPTQLQRGGGQNNGGQNGDGQNNDGPRGDDPKGKDNRQSSIANLDNTIAVRWSNLFLELDRYALGMRPNATARAIAYINLAAYETAIPGMQGFQSNSRAIPGLRIRDNNRREAIDWQVALNACYADVLDHFLLNMPDAQRAKIGILESSLETELIENTNGRTINDSKNWGASVAAQIIEFSQTDEAAEAQILDPQPLSYEPPTGDGYWTYSAEQERALFPYWESVRTFVIAPQQTTSVPPMAYSEDPNSEYFQQMQEVYKVNNRAREEDGEDLWIAEFWSDDIENLMFSPPARQISIASQLISEQSLNLEESLHLLLKLGFSLNDAAVSTWKYKYEYMVMRPNVFIHEFIDPSYQTNLYRLIPWPNPTFPGYPSGHSAFASAAAGVFINFFGPDANFTDRSHEGRTEFRGQPRSFDTFENMATENGYSRVPLGVHISIDCTEGLRLGYEISNAINSYSVRKQES